MPVVLGLIILAAGLGAGIMCARLCLLNAADDWMVRGDAAGLRVHARLVAVLAGLFLVQLVLMPATALAPTTGRTIALAAIGGLLLAAGTIVNGGCYLGSISQIGVGRSRFVFTLVGIYLAEIHSFPRQLMLGAQEMILPAMAAPAVSVLAAGGAVLACLYLPRAAAADRRERNGGVMVAALCATGLFLVLPGASYGAAIAALAHPHGSAPGLRLLVAAGIFAGAIAASLLSGRWGPELPDLAGSGRCLAGGYAMAAGAQCVPGGSDSWLLWTIPRGGMHGLVAYFVGGGSVLLWCWLRARFQAARAGRTITSA